MKRVMRLLRVATFFLLGCAAEAPTTGEPTAPTPGTSDRAGPAPSVVPGNCVCGTEPGCPPCPTPSATASSTANTPSAPVSGTFPPAAITPPVERTKKPGDGVWTPIAVYGAAAEASPVYTTVIHPHKIRDFVIVAIVAIDLSRITMDLVMGTGEPEGSDFAKDKRPGIVSAQAKEDLVAITNGGFKKRHGGHGVGAFGEIALAPSPQFCTFAKTKDGRYLVGTYSKISAELDKGFTWFRQTPPCLMEDGVPHPDLSAEYKAKKWGGAEDGNKEIRRSAVGLGADGRTLYFAISDYSTAEWLTDGLVAAGVKTAAELDINYNYTRFIVYQRSGADLVPSSPLLTDLKAPKREYIKEPAERDFFTLRWIKKP